MNLVRLMEGVMDPEAEPEDEESESSSSTSSSGSSTWRPIRSRGIALGEKVVVEMGDFVNSDGPPFGE